MANTYSKVYLHIIFAVKNRNALLHESWRAEVFQYMAGIINKRGNYSLAVNGYHNYVHLFLDFKGNEIISDLVRELKKASNKLIKTKGYCRNKFEWQPGYGIFSHGYKEKDTVIQYIKNQKTHREKTLFSQEYLQLLKSFEIDFKQEYLFEFHE